MKESIEKMSPQDIFGYPMVLPIPVYVEKERNANINQIKTELPNTKYQSGSFGILKILTVLSVGFCMYKIQEKQRSENERRKDKGLSDILFLADKINDIESKRREEENSRIDKNNKLFLESLKSFNL